MTNVAASRALGSLKIEALDYEDEADIEKNIHVKTENDYYCSANLNGPLNASDSRLTINVKEVPVEYEVSIKEELDVGPTVLQPSYSSVSPLHATEENRENLHGNLQPYIVQLVDRDFGTKPKSSRERMKEYPKRKRETASFNFSNIASASDLWSQITTNDAAARKEEIVLHMPDDMRKNSLLGISETGLARNSERIFRTAKPHENRKRKRLYITPDAAETAAGRYRSAVEGKYEDLLENHDNLEENLKSDEAVLLTDRASNINDGIIAEDSSNIDDPLRLNDARGCSENFITAEPSIIEHSSCNNEKLKSSKERVRKFLANRKQSAKSCKGTRNEARPPNRRLCATKKKYSDNMTPENCMSTERSRREQDSGRAAAPISTRNMIVSKSTADGKKMLVCGLCNTEFKFMSRITKHLRSHTGEKPFSCGECDARFKLPHHLIQHQRTHTGERPYRCDLCDMTFRQTAHLIIHKRTHTGEKPYRCKVCGAQFRQSGSLTYHEQKHVGERTEYQCDMCDDKFEDANDLSHHEQTHKGEKLEYGVYHVKFKQSRSLVGYKRTMKVFQVVEF